MANFRDETMARIHDMVKNGPAMIAETRALLIAELDKSIRIFLRDRLARQIRALAHAELLWRTKYSSKPTLAEKTNEAIIARIQNRK
jgi:hypothetical protein